ncbi:unnamed protein product [Rhizophagus irregularis]|nr:unnamed protein product [Rhizophagus irregularis]
MFKKKNAHEDNADLQPPKRQKRVESLQELVHVRPDLKKKPVYFFPALDKYYEGVLMYDIKIKKAYVYSVKGDCKFDTFLKWISYLQNRGYFKGHKYEVYVFDKIIQKQYFPFPIKEMKRTLDEIINLVRYVFSVNICYGQSTTGYEDVVCIRDTQLISNNKDHIPFALLERRGQSDKAY